MSVCAFFGSIEWCTVLAVRPPTAGVSRKNNALWVVGRSSHVAEYIKTYRVRSSSRKSLDRQSVTARWLGVRINVGNTYKTQCSVL